MVGAGLESGVDALKNVTEIPFPEFTAKLVSSTFDTIIAATIHQMEAYAALVANLATTIEDFQAENVNDAEISKYLMDNYPDGSGGTSVRSDFEFTDTAADGDTPAESGNAKLNKVYKSIVEQRLAKFWSTTGEPVKPAEISANTVKSFTKEQVQKIRAGVARSLATTQMDQLRGMASQGMARIVVDQFEIFSKLTFHVASTDIDATSKASYQQQQASAYVRGGYGCRWYNVNAGASYGSLTVKTANESTYSKVTMDAEIIGSVLIRGHTETFPSLVTTPATT